MSLCSRVAFVGKKVELRRCCYVPFWIPFYGLCGRGERDVRSFVPQLRSPAYYYYYYYFFFCKSRVSPQTRKLVFFFYLAENQQRKTKCCHSHSNLLISFFSCFSSLFFFLTQQHFKTNASASGEEKEKLVDIFEHPHFCRVVAEPYSFTVPFFFLLSFFFLSEKKKRREYCCFFFSNSFLHSLNRCK